MTSFLIVESESEPFPNYDLFPNRWKWKSLSHILLFATSWTVESMGISRPESWSGEPFPSPVDLPNPGIEPRSPALQADSFPAEPPGKPQSFPNRRSACSLPRASLPPLSLPPSYVPPAAYQDPSLQPRFYHWAENIQLSFIPPQERLKPFLSGCQSTAQVKDGGDKVTSSPHRAGVRTSWGDMRVSKTSEPKCESITGHLKRTQDCKSIILQ